LLCRAHWRIHDLSEPGEDAVALVGLPTVADRTEIGDQI
jgi:hypothetical protein